VKRLTSDQRQTEDTFFPVNYQFSRLFLGLSLSRAIFQFFTPPTGQNQQQLLLATQSKQKLSLGRGTI